MNFLPDEEYRVVRFSGDVVNGCFVEWRYKNPLLRLVFGGWDEYTHVPTDEQTAIDLAKSLKGKTPVSVVWPQ